MGNPLQHKRMYGTATVGTKGQIVIPAEARDDLNIQPGDKLYIANASHGAGFICIKEEMLEEMVARLSEHLESFRALRGDGQTGGNKN